MPADSTILTLPFTISIKRLKEDIFSLLQRVFGMGELQARINGAILTSQPKYVALSLLNHGKVSRKSRAGRRSGQSDCGIDQRTQSCSLGEKRLLENALKLF